MTRYASGVIFGAACSGIAYAAGATPFWAGAIGLTAACLLWATARR